MLRFEILALFVNTVTAHGKYACCKRENFLQATQMQLFKNQICFINFLLYFSNLHQIFNILKRKIKLIAQLYLILLTSKDFLT